jgi:hypothetical protein
MREKFRSAKKDYHLLIYPYLFFPNVKKIVRGLNHLVSSGGNIHIIVPDAALYGVYIPTH